MRNSSTTVDYVQNQAVKIANTFLPTAGNTVVDQHLQIVFVAFLITPPAFY